MRLPRILDILSERVADRTLREHFKREIKVLSLEMLRTTTLIGMFLFPLLGTLDIIDIPALGAEIVNARGPGRDL
jgi:hypothetical protein